jgi:hypothetical protein
VSSQPSNPAQLCTVTNGSGTVAASDIADILVICADAAFAISGTISGLEGTGLVLRDNAGESIPIAPGARSFAFATKLADRTPYSVEVETPPSNPSQTCEVSNATGTINGADVTNVTVNCSTPGDGVGAIQTDRSMLSFGQIDLTVRREEDVTFRNTGTAAVTFQPPTIVGSNQFTVAGSTCLGAIGAGEICIVKVAATPGVVGAATGELRAETSVGTVTVDLSVIGSALVTASVTGPGRVTSIPPGIDCGGGGGACSARFTATSVVLATDDATTVRWITGCAGNGPCSLVLDQARTVTATTYAPLRRTFNDDDNGFDACHAIAAGPSDSMVITGENQRLAQGYNAWSRAYDASGNVLWSYEIDTPSEGQDRGSDVVALGDGSAVIAGKWYSGSNTRQNYFLAKVSSAGGRVWFQESTIVNDDMYLGVASDSNGSLIVAGFQPDAGGVPQAWVRKLGSGGTGEQWAVTRNGTASGSDAASKVAIDSADNVIVAGYEANAATGRDGWIAKYALNGAPIWNISVASSGTTSDEATDVAVAGDDTIVAVGNSGTASWIRALTAAGAPRWDLALADANLRAVAIDPGGSVLVTGTSGAGLTVRKYSSAGVLNWERNVAGAKGNGIAADAAGNVLVCGEETVDGNKTNVLVLKLYQ